MRFSARLWLGVCLAALAPVSGPGADMVEQSGRELEARIKSLLPPGWVVEYIHHEEGLEVKRRGEIDQLEEPGSQKTYRGEFSFFYTVKPALSPGKYTRIVANNNRYAGWVRDTEAKMRARGLKPGENNPAPRNKEEKELVETRELFLTTQLSLPTFRYRDMSLTPYTEFSKFAGEDWRAVVDGKIRQECQEVQARVIALLIRYDGKAADAK